MTDLIWWAIALLFLAVSLNEVFRSWRGKGKKGYRRGMAAWAPLSTSAINATWRAMPVGASSFSVLIIWVLIYDLVLVRIDEPWLESIINWTLLTAWLGSAAALLPIVWWNVPKLVVSPLYRRQPGLVKLWWRRRSIRRLATSEGAS